MIRSPVVPEMFVFLFTVAPKTCTTAASTACSPRWSCEPSETTSEAPGSTVTGPSIVAPAMQVTPLSTVSPLLRLPVIVVVHAGDAPGSTVALNRPGVPMLPDASIARCSIECVP